MEALGMEEDLIEGIMNFRAGEDGEMGTEDDGEIKSTGQILNSLRESIYFSVRDEQALASLISRNMFCVKSDNYQIAANIYVHDKLVNSYTIIFSKDKNRYSIKEWTHH